MSRTKKADHRQVQPREEHYVEQGGIRFLVGPYSVEQRRAYIDTNISLTQTRFPNLSYAKAKEAAFHKWRNIVFATIADEKVHHDA